MTNGAFYDWGQDHLDKKKVYVNEEWLGWKTFHRESLMMLDLGLYFCVQTFVYCLYF